MAGSVTGGVERSLGRGQIGRSRHPTPVGGDNGMHCFGWRVRVGISASPCALQLFYFAGVYVWDTSFPCAWLGYLGYLGP